MPRDLAAFAALNAMLALTFGTFAVHGIRDPQARDWIMTGVLFQLPHVAAVFALIAWRQSRPVVIGAWLVSVGSFLFATVLTLLAMGVPRPVAALAPAGGTLMMLGWTWIALIAMLGTRLERFWDGRPHEGSD
jgi:uncharacterized membrane protein YgdD (TMEM256/DUF423 family)